MNTENCSLDSRAGAPGDYGPAYRFGLTARRRYPLSDFDDIECELSGDWSASRGASILTWKWAKHAARDAWNRISPSTLLCA